MTTLREFADDLAAGRDWTGWTPERVNTNRREIVTKAQEWLTDHDMGDKDGTDLRMPSGDYLDEYLFPGLGSNRITRHPSVMYRFDHGEECEPFSAELYEFADGSGVLIVDAGRGIWATTDRDSEAEHYSPTKDED